MRGGSRRNPSTRGGSRPPEGPVVSFWRVTREVLKAASGCAAKGPDLFCPLKETMSPLGNSNGQDQLQLRGQQGMANISVASCGQEEHQVNLIFKPVPITAVCVLNAEVPAAPRGGPWFWFVLYGL